MNNDIRKLVDDNWDEIKELIAQKAEAEAEQKPKSIWDLDMKDGERYYYLSSNGVIGQGIFNTCYDKGIRALGNTFLTREEAEFELERRKIEAIMRKYSSPFKYGDENWYIAYYHDEKDFSVTAYLAVDYGIPYFESAEIAEKVIDEIGQDRLKKYWFRVK